MAQALISKLEANEEGYNGKADLERLLSEVASKTPSDLPEGKGLMACIREASDLRGERWCDVWLPEVLLPYTTSESTDQTKFPGKETKTELQRLTQERA